MDVRPLGAGDSRWVAEFVTDRWGAPTVVSRGRVHRPSELPGFIAAEGGEPVGLATYAIDDEACELVTIDSLTEGVGVGSALVETVKETAAAAGCRRLWLVTTNDNLRMLRFAQKRGFSLVAVHPNALEESRRLKPEIGLVGQEGIPLRDELELELRLEPD
jgi:N-acetylglutamate synthase-like GNAT family acetyltransferase